MEELRAEIQKGEITESKGAYGSKAQSGFNKSAQKGGGNDDDSDNSQILASDRKRPSPCWGPPDLDELPDEDDRDWRQRIEKKRKGSV